MQESIYGLMQGSIAGILSSREVRGDAGAMGVSLAIITRHPGGFLHTLPFH
jgi:hypothetical protein